jgi:hypothetical protein
MYAASNQRWIVGTKIGGSHVEGFVFAYSIDAIIPAQKTEEDRTSEKHREHRCAIS